MSGGIFNPGAGESVNARFVDQNIGDRLAGKVSAFDKHRARSHFAQHDSGARKIIDAFHGYAC